MRRRGAWAVAGTIAAVLSAATPAAAGEAVYEGEIAGANPDAYFATVYATTKKGKPTRVTRVSWNGIPGQCSNGSEIVLSGGAFHEGKGYKVRDRKFAFESEAEDATGDVVATYEIEGKFAGNAKSVKGTIYQAQENFGGAVTCEGSAKYEAAK
jgi:hypothetical protein